MSSTLKLNCWVVDDNVNSIFPITIEKDETVGSLKEAIMRKNPDLGHIAARSLHLWKDSIPHQELAQKVNALGLAEESILSPLDKLSKVFSEEPTDRHIHIIVRRPLTGECLSCWLAVHRDLNSLNLASDHLTLQCWVFSHASDRVFPVEIGKTKTVGALKDAIKDKRKPDFDHVAADSLMLWKVSSFQRIDGAARRMLAMALKGRHRQA